jgi:LCP family protein required for cell wall assembly
MPAANGTSRDAAILFLACLVLAVGGVGCYDSLAHPGVASAQISADYHPTLMRPLPAPFAGRGILRILILGSDTRPHDKGRADTMMVMFINPATHRVAILNIPRDLRVAIPGHGTDKINHSYAFGGPDLSRRTVAGVIGEDITQYIHCDFDAFIKATDLVHGVDVDVPDVEGKGRGMNYDDNWGNLHCHLKPGFQHLNGTQAIGFVRYRHGDSDFNRTERQGQFMRAVFEQKLKVTNLPSLLSATSYVVRRLDTNVSWRDTVDLLRVAREMKHEDLLTVSIPIIDQMIGGIYYAGFDENKLREILSTIQGHLNGVSGAVAPALAAVTGAKVGTDAPTAPAATDATGAAAPATIVVLNASGAQGLAKRVAKQLTVKGWTIARTGNTPGKAVPTSHVEYPEGARDIAKRLAGDVGLPPRAVRPAAVGVAEVRVVLGRDMSGGHQAKGG